MGDNQSVKNSTNNQTRIWNDPKVRAIVFQILAAASVAAFLFYIVGNALHNMEQRGITTGFDFLTKTSGFGIIQSLIPYDETQTFGRTFFVGLLNTFLVSFLGIIMATILGFAVGIARLSNNWLLARLATVFVETFRNIPLLLQIFFWYFAVLQTLPSPRQSIEISGTFFLNIRGFYMPDPIPQDGFFWVVAAFVIAVAIVVALSKFNTRRQKETGQQMPVFWYSLGILVGLPLLTFIVLGAPLAFDYPALKGFNFRGGITIIPELLALLTALTIYTSTYIAEIVRSGIEAIPKGQSEAASALGLTNGQRLRLVIIPQSLRVIIPPLTNQYLNLTKNSSLATAIGYPDLVSVFMGTTLNQTGQAIEIIFMTMAVYLFFSLSISLFMNWYNKRVSLVER